MSAAPDIDELHLFAAFPEHFVCLLNAYLVNFSPCLFQQLVVARHVIPPDANLPEYAILYT
jgi:hypothetical protein